MERAEVQVTMTNWAIPLTPRPTVGFTGEHDVTEFEVLTTPENGVTYYLEVKAWRKEPNNILFDKESDRLTVRLTSEMLGAAGIHKAQVVAYLTDGDDTPIKKSNIFEIEVKNSINATKDVEPHYQSALEQWTQKLNEMSGLEYTAGDGIAIEDDVISVDDTIARKSNLSEVIHYVDDSLDGVMRDSTTYQNNIGSSSIDCSNYDKLVIYEFNDTSPQTLQFGYTPYIDGTAQDTVFISTSSFPSSDIDISDYDAIKFVTVALHGEGSSQVYYTLLNKVVREREFKNKKVSADNVDDTISTNKFTNATEKGKWNSKVKSFSLNYQYDDNLEMCVVDLRESQYPDIQQNDLLVDDYWDSGENNVRIYECLGLSNGQITIRVVKNAVVNITGVPIDEVGEECRYDVGDVLLSANGNIYRCLSRTQNTADATYVYTWKVYGNIEPKYELIDTLEITEPISNYTFDFDGVDDILIVCENILGGSGKRFNFRLPLDGVSLNLTTDYSISDTTPKTYYFEHKRINENLYQSVINGAFKNDDIQNYTNTNSYESKLKRVQMQIGSGLGSELTAGTIKIYGKKRF